MTLPLLQELSVALGVGATDLMRIISTAPARYKVYRIAKRNGGTRVIAQPARELKVIQRYILNSKLVSFPIHPAASGYIEGPNIGDNATRHARSSFILKLDFVDFFPSINVEDWELVAKKNGLKGVDLLLFYRILFWGQGSSDPKCLSIGAPTSPALSNIIMYNIDRVFTSAARRMGVTYSRYADDITLSASRQEVLLEFEQFSGAYLQELSSPKLFFNDQKRGMYGRATRRMVTGLIITPQGEISIGRERKRKISAMLHKASLGQLELKELAKLKGLLAFSFSVEPQFIDRMRRKYGGETVDAVFRIHRVRRAKQKN